jgi:hypothetical protein
VVEWDAIAVWELEPFESDCTELVFIGNKVAAEKEMIVSALGKCAAKNDEARMPNVEGMTKHE